MSDTDTQLAQLLAQNATLFAAYEDWANGQVMLLAGTTNDPDSFDATGGKTGALGYYPVVNVSGQTMYVPCIARLKAIALGGANAETLDEILDTANTKLAAVDQALTDTYTARDQASTQATYAGAQGDYAKQQALAIGDVAAAVASTGANKQAAEAAKAAAEAAQVGATGAVNAGITGLGFNPSVGYEADLTGVVAADLDRDGNLLDYFDAVGRRQIESPLFLSQPVSAPSIALGGVRETNLVGYEADLCGWSRVFVDRDGKLLPNDDGSGHFPVDGPIRSAFGATFDGELGARQLTLNGVRETNLVGYEADLCGGAYFVVDKDGKLLSGASSGASDLTTYTTATHADGSIAGVELIGGKPQIVTYDAPSGTRTVLTTDGASNVAPAITAAKQVIYTSDATGSAKRMWKPLLGGAAWPVAASALIVIDGDSIGENFTSGFTPTLMTMLPTRVIQPEAIGGQRSDQIAKRNGALPITTAIFAGNQVPASGAVAVTGIDVLQSTSNRSMLVDVYGTDGTIVQGVLAFTASGSTYAFTRSSAGAVLPVPAGGVTLVPRSGLSQVYAIEDLRVGIHVYQAGRNDVGKVDYNEDTSFANITAMVSTNMPIAKRWLIDGVIPGLTDLPVSQGGTAASDAASLLILQRIQSLNARLAAYAGSRFVDMLGAIKTAGLTSQFTVSGQQFDIPNTDFSGTDGLHPTQPAGKTAMAGEIVTKMTLKGWLA